MKEEDNNTTPMTDLNDILKLLILCTQEGKSRFSDTHIRELAPSIEIQSLLKTAMEHGVISFVYSKLKSILSAAELVPFKEAYLSSVKHTMFNTAELLQIVKSLKTEHIDFMPFKGPVLSQLLYNDVTQRQYGDLDILIQKSDILKVAQILKNFGYVPIYSLSPTQYNVWYQHAKDMTFIHPHKQTHIDVHWKLMDSDHPVQIHLKEIWRHPRPVMLRGIPLTTFSNEEMISYLCIHGSKHLWERMGWIKDIDAFIRTQTLNWDKFVHLMQNNRSERLVLLGLSLSYTLYSTPLPAELHKKIEQHSVFSEITKFIFLNWESEQNMIANTSAMLKLFPKLSMKLRYLWKIIFKPSQNEYRFADLPYTLYWGYYLIRPYLLIKKYIKRA